MNWNEKEEEEEETIIMYRPRREEVKELRRG